ncbi:hypothetical protein C1H46_025344 [Malus baccata]|uniref:SMP domain-containing protein n=1 Tax=Malus baccata TaxID=106549 RepID=A0A540LRM6_MALBA|nr:hypothetical protein C1H46_025344 [Malus baccata]
MDIKVVTLFLCVFGCGLVVGQYVQLTRLDQATAGGFMQQNSITIGEALKALAQIAGDRPIDQNDGAVIQAAEVRVTGSNVISPGWLDAMAQAAAAYNAGTEREQDKIKLIDILSAICKVFDEVFFGSWLKGAAAKLPSDKAATRQDGEVIVSAELRKNMGTRPGGAVASVMAAAKLNENINI